MIFLDGDILLEGHLSDDDAIPFVFSSSVTSSIAILASGSVRKFFVEYKFPERVMLQRSILLLLSLTLVASHKGPVAIGKHCLQLKEPATPISSSQSV